MRAFFSMAEEWCMKESSFNPRFDMDMIDVEGDSVMSPVVGQFHDDPRVKTVAAGALTAVET